MEASDQRLADAMKAWHQGNQEVAIDVVRPLADQGDSAALLLILWFLSQAGEPQGEAAMSYAKKAADSGNQWILSNYFPHFADKSDDRSAAIALVRSSPSGGFISNDPLGRAIEFVGQEDPEHGVEMLRAAAGPHPWPQDPEETRQRAAEIEQILTEVSGRRQEVASAFDTASRDLEQIQEDFRTRESTLTQFLDDLTNVTAEFEFEKQAKRYGTESTVFWVFGLLVLFAAACAAILPLILNYANPEHHGLHDQSNVSAHLGAALAFAAVAGVLLARARNRDRDRQRNRDLSVALITMFAYSEQIANEQEKERFKHDMGRLVIEAFLRQEPPGEDRSNSIVSEFTSRGVPAGQPQES
jgi:hypothetical protein